MFQGIKVRLSFLFLWASIVCSHSIAFCIFVVMDFWTIIGIVSSLFGIYSFLKNDTSLFSLFKKNIHLTVIRNRYINSLDIKKI